MGPAWGSLDDIVMGGVSASSLQISLSGGEKGGPVALFKGGSPYLNEYYAFQML